MNNGKISQELFKKGVKEYRIGQKKYSAKDLQTELSKDLYHQKYSMLKQIDKNTINDFLKTMLNGVGYKGSAIKREIYKAHNYNKKDIVNYLIKGGSNKKYAEAIVKRHWDYIHRAYHNQSLNKKTIKDIMITLGLST